jgi:hypothetical protein
MATNSSCFQKVRARDSVRDAVKRYTLFAEDRRLGSIWAADIVPNPEDPHMVMVRSGEDIIAIFEATEFDLVVCRSDGSSSAGCRHV